MDIYCLIDSYDFDEDVAPNAPAIITAIENWLAESRSSAQLINKQDEQQLGLSINTKRVQTLKKPIAFLFTLTEQWPLDFVIGVDNNGEREDICYFGKEEGHPDISEIANYLGLSH